MRHPTLKSDLSAIGLLLLVCACFFWRVFLKPQEMLVSPYSDVVGQFGYWEEFLKEGLESFGRFPQYNPFSLAGNPVTGNPQYLEYYPFRLASLLLPPHWAVGFNFFLHAWLLCVFTYALAKELGLDPVASLLAGLLAGLNARYLSFVYAGFSLLLPSVTFLPLVWTGLFMAARGRLLAGIGLSGMGLALCFMGGWPQIALFCLMSVGVLAIGAWALTPLPRKRVGGWLLAFLICFPLMGAGLAAIKLLPALMLAPLTTRTGGMPLEVGSQYSLTLRHLWGFLSPRLFGSPMTGDYWGKPNFWEMGCYMSGTGMVLALIGLQSGQKRWQWPMAALLSFGLLFSLGSASPLFSLLYKLVPGLDHFRAPGRMMFCAIIALSVLAGHGLSWMAEDRMNARGRALAISLSFFLGVVFFLGVGLAFKSPANGPLIQTSSGLLLTFGQALSGSGREILLAVVWFGLPLVLLLLGPRLFSGQRSLQAIWVGIAVLDLFVHSQGSLTTVPEKKVYPRSEVGEFLAQQKDGPSRVLDLCAPAYCLPDGLAWRYRLESVSGYDPTNLSSFARAFALLKGEGPARGPQWEFRTSVVKNRNLLDLFNVRYLVSDQPLEWPNLRLLRTFNQVETFVQFRGSEILPEVHVYENLQVAPRLSGWWQAWSVDEEKGWDLLAEELSDLRSTVLLFSSVPVSTGFEGGRPSGDLLHLQSYDRASDEIRCTVEAAQGCWVLASEIFCPGWEVQVDGRPVELYRANGCFMTFQIQSGSHEVVLRYRAPGARAGSLVTGCSLLMWMGVWILVLKRPRP